MALQLQPEHTNLPIFDKHLVWLWLKCTDTLWRKSFVLCHLFFIWNTKVPFWQNNGLNLIWKWNFLGDTNLSALPHSKKVMGWIPGSGAFLCGVCMFCVCVGFPPGLQLPPTVQRRGSVCQLSMVWKFKRECGWLFVCLCWPAINWQLAQGVTRLTPDRMHGLQH